MRVTRSRVVAALPLLAAALVLAGCGDDSTSTGKPTSSTSPASSQNGGPNVAPNTPHAGSPETMHTQVNPSPPPAAPLGPKETTYLAALKKAGATPSGDGTIAVSVAKVVCGAKEHGGMNEQTTAIVNAIVGQDAQQSGKTLTDEGVAQLGKVYVDTASSTYCK